MWDRRSENGARKVDDDLRGGVRELLTGSPEDHGFTRPTWTLEILRMVVAQVLGVALSVACLWTLVRGIGARWGRPRPIVACPWKAARRQRRIAALKRLAASASAQQVVVYADEVDIHLNPKLGVLSAKASSVLNTASLPGANGVSGTITIAHDGRYGELYGKAVALEPATGFSFDSALEPRLVAPPASSAVPSP